MVKIFVEPGMQVTQPLQRSLLCGPTMFHFAHSQHPLLIPNNGRNTVFSPDFFLQKNHLIKNVAKKSLVHKKI